MIPRSPLAIPQGFRGSLFVLHETLPPGTIVHSRTLRSAVLAGGRAESETLSRPLMLHKLLRLTDEQIARAAAGGKLSAGERAQVMMSDHPAEVRWMEELAAGTCGRVLVAGLGLGLLVEILAARDEVERIDVVELDPDVVWLTYGHLSERARLKTSLVVDNVTSYLEGATVWPWDFALLDTWYGTGQETWDQTVAPLRRLIRRRHGARQVRAWCEPEMLGQVRHGMAAFSVAPANACRSSRAQWAFRMATATVLPPVAPSGRLARSAAGLARLCDPLFRAHAAVYLGEVGSDVWEARFGAFWDGWTSGDLRAV